MIHKISSFINRNKDFLFKLLVLWLVVSIIVIFNQKEEIENGEFQVKDLENEKEVLTSKIRDLENEKEELESDSYSYSQENEKENYQSYSSTTSSSSNYNTISDEDAYLSKGSAIVVYKMSSCDYFILESNSGFIIAQWMGSNEPSQGDQVAGDFNNFGTDTFYNVTRSTESKLWIDNYMLSKDSALEKITEKCD